MKLYQRTFDALLAERLKEEGMEASAVSRSELLEIARAEAVLCAMSAPERTCIADDVQRRLIALGFEPADLGNAAGSIFRGREWEWTGAYAKSERASSHRNLLKVWRLKG